MTLSTASARDLIFQTPCACVLAQLIIFEIKNILMNFGSDNGFKPVWRQAITRTNAALRTNFSEICIKIQPFNYKKMNLKMSSAKCQPFVSASVCPLQSIKGVATDSIHDLEAWISSSKIGFGQCWPDVWTFLFWFWVNKTSQGQHIRSVAFFVSNMISVRSRRWACLVTWFCYHLIAKPGNKIGTLSWPNRYQIIAKAGSKTGPPSWPDPYEFSVFPGGRFADCHGEVSM